MAAGTRIGPILDPKYWANLKNAALLRFLGITQETRKLGQNSAGGRLDVFQKRNALRFSLEKPGQPHGQRGFRSDGSGVFVQAMGLFSA